MIVSSIVHCIMHAIMNLMCKLLKKIADEPCSVADTKTVRSLRHNFRRISFMLAARHHTFLNPPSPPLPKLLDRKILLLFVIFFRICTIQILGSTHNSDRQLNYNHHTFLNNILYRNQNHCFHMQFLPLYLSYGYQWIVLWILPIKVGSYKFKI